jgi:two-component system chemotaxis response regulator CheB
MPRHDVVVAGASAGGVEALSTLLHGLPADFPAAVFVVLHMPSGGTS